MDRLRAIGVFVEVADRGSLTAAAEALDVSRAMVSRYLADLEEWLGVRLFHRTTRRISLTSAGEAALAHCRELIALSDGMREALVDATAAPTGSIRVTCSSSFGHSYLARAVAEFVARHPHVSVDLLMLDRTVNLVEERVDLAIRMAHELDPNLIARQLSVCRSVLCASPAYLAARGTPQRPEDLVRHNCLTHHFVGKSLWTLGRGADAVSVAVGGNISANDASAVMAAALADAGISLLPTYLAAPHLHDGSLVSLLPSWPPKTMGIHAVYASRQRMPPAVRAFLDFIADRLGDVPPWDAGVA